MSERVNPRSLEGCRRLVFDSTAWSDAGHDIGDNSCFYEPATIRTVYNRDGEWLAEVEFDDGRRSRGHFVSGLREIG